MDFTVAKCPNPECGCEVTTEDVPQPLRLFIALAALMVHASSMEGLMQLPEYAAIKQNWDERITGITDQALQESEELQLFGEMFDKDEEDEDE